MAIYILPNVLITIGVKPFLNFAFLRDTTTGTMLPQYSRFHVLRDELLLITERLLLKRILKGFFLRDC